MATGMDWPDEKDFGLIEADSHDEAINKAAHQEVPEDTMYGPNNSWSTRDWYKSGLSAKLIRNE